MSGYLEAEFRNSKGEKPVYIGSSPFYQPHETQCDQEIIIAPERSAEVELRRRGDERRWNIFAVQCGSADDCMVVGGVTEIRSG